MLFFIFYYMKSYLLFAYSLLLFACTNKPNFPTPAKSDIDSIVKTIIIQDSLSVQNIPLSINLRKLDVYIAKTKLPPPPHTYIVDIKHLLSSSYFNRKDSSYLMFQNKILKGYTLNKASFGKLKFTTTAEQEKHGEDMFEFARYLDISIPILSLDQKRAYVQLDRICPGCGCGFFYILEKKNGNWEITSRQKTWMN